MADKVPGTKPGLLGLPRDFLLMVVMYLPQNDRLRLRAVCKETLEIVTHGTESWLLRTRIPPRETGIIQRPPQPLRVPLPEFLRMFPRIQALRFEDLTNIDFLPLLNCAYLSDLSVSKCTWVKASLEECLMRGLPKLERIHLRGLDKDQTGVGVALASREFRRQEEQASGTQHPVRLKFLYMVDCRWGGRVHPMLVRSATELEGLNLRNVSGVAGRRGGEYTMIAEPSPVAESVCGMTKLKYLGLGPSVAVSADIMLRLCTSLSNLRRLSLTCDETLDDIGMSHIVHLRKLERLVLTGGFSDCGLAYLGELKELTSVHLVQCGKIMGKGLRALATLPKLEDVHLVMCSHLEQIDGLAGSKTIDAARVISCNRVPMAEFRSLKSLPLGLLHIGVRDLSRVPVWQTRLAVMLAEAEGRKLVMISAGEWREFLEAEFSHVRKRMVTET